MENKMDIIHLRLRAAAYIRVSTQEQAMHGMSLAAQEMKLTEYAQNNNLDIVAWYRDEGVSGRKLISKRPELQRMIQDAQAGKFDRIIFIKLDRFFRSVAEYHKCMEMLGDIPWTATEEKYDLATANGRMFVNMKLTIAELEADQTGERIKLVHEYKAKSGIPMMGTRSLPFCYENPQAENGERRKLVKRNEAAMIDLIEYVETHNSIRGGMDFVNQKYGLHLLYRSVAAALRNPLICGEYRGNLNYCDPYITRERFQALQETLQRNTRTTPLHDYIFQGMILCPECGHILTGTQHNSVNGKYRYHYTSYRCPNHRISKRCDFATVVFENHLEQLLVAYLQNYLSAFSISSESGTAQNQIIDIAPMQAELQRVNYAWEKGRLSPEEYDRKYDEISARIKKAEQQNASAATQPKVQSILPPDWDAAYQELSSAHKREFWKSIISSIEINWNPGKKSKKEITKVNFI